MTDYTTLSDPVLQRLATEGDGRAEEQLAMRYSRLVRICARPYFLSGGDSEDLTQEGMLGLLSAIRQYDGGSGASFKTFAEHCIRNRLISAVKSALRQKHTHLTTVCHWNTSSQTKPRPIRRHFLNHLGAHPRKRFLPERAEWSFIQPFHGVYPNSSRRFYFSTWRAYLTGRLRRKPIGLRNLLIMPCSGFDVNWPENLTLANSAGAERI